MKRNITLPLAVAILCLTACSNEHEPETPYATAPLASITTTLPQLLPSLPLQGGSGQRPRGAGEVPALPVTDFVPGDIINLTYYQGATPYTAQAVFADGEDPETGFPTPAEWQLSTPIHLNTTGDKALEATFIPAADQLRDATDAEPTIYFDHLYAEANAANGKLTVHSNGTASASLYFAHTRSQLTLSSIRQTDGTDIATLHAYINDPEGTTRKLEFDLTRMEPAPGGSPAAVIAPAGATLNHLHLMHANGQLFTATGTPLTLKAGKSHPLDIVLKGNTGTFSINTIADWTAEDNTNNPAEQLGYDKLIATAQDLIDFRNAVNAGTYNSGANIWKVLQTADIDLGSIPNWTSIGDNGTNRFQGTYNGNGYTITGLTVNNGARYAGLFGRTEYATLYNIHLRGCHIINTGGTDTYAGPLVASAAISTISQCSATGQVNGAQHTGGLIGILANSHLTRSRSTCNVTNAYAGSDSDKGSVGGLVGYSASLSRIAACSAVGAVKTTGTYNYAGGLVGYNHFGDITCCYATGVTTVAELNNIAGGLTGFSGNTNTIIYNSYATGHTDLIGENNGEEPRNCTTSIATPALAHVIFQETDAYTGDVRIITGGATITAGTTVFTPSRVWNADYTLNYNHTEQ